MRLTTVADAEAAAARAAEVVARLVRESRAARGIAHLALAGGSTPRRAYELLAPMLEDWSDIHVWFGDERCVAPDDPDSNYRMVSESLLGHAGIDESNVHRIRGELGPEAGAVAYAQELRATVAGDDRGVPILDVAMLGLGEDGHTASLFGGGRALRATGAICMGVTDAPKPPPERITLTLDVLRAAGRCVLLASGAPKADAVAAVLAGPSVDVPASLLREGSLEMIIDDAAAPPPPGGHS
jgi:6-phosphogluconolactonase